jgi:3',5'-cyclic AMP phosphodiesterase CpdA
MFRQNMAAHLKDVVVDILSASKPPGAVVIDGDLALWDGQPGDYSTLLTLLEPLRAAKIAIHMALGNHDDRANFRAAVPSRTLVESKQVSAVDLPGLRFVILDSLEKAPQTPGLLGTAQLDWLRSDLDAHPETPTIVFHHHHLEHVPWSTVPGLSDGQSLMEMVRSRRQVKALVFGHTHIWTVRREPGQFLINLPAVAYAFDHHQPLGYCRLKPDPSGAAIELKCVGGNRKAQRQRLRLDW